MGKRGPKTQGPEKRDERVMVSMMPSERRAFEAAADGVPLSTWLRDAGVMRLAQAPLTTPTTSK